MDITSNIYPEVVTEKTVYDHNTDGIIIVYGNGVIPNRINHVKSVDVAPTILNCLNLPIPEDTDGKIIEGTSPTPMSPRCYNYLNHWKLTKK